MVATASNDFRLGANEAPPAIISVFLGEQLADVFQQIKAGGAKSSKTKSKLEIGVDTLPKLPRDPGDRNRTSPMAFCGNRFEFRAVGSGQSIAGPIIAINTAVAESLDFIATKLEAAVSAGKTLNSAVQTVLAEITAQHDGVVFSGNGYTPEWHAEAEKRGLPNFKTTVDSLPVLQQPEVVQLFEKYGVLSPRELGSRYEIYFEQYVKSVLVEARLVGKMGKTMILPAALRYQTELAQGAQAVKAVGLSPTTKPLEQVNSLIGELEKSLATLEATMAHQAKSVVEEAKHLQQKVLPAMLAVRAPADALENVVAHDLWPLPTYQQMLFPG